MSSVREIARMVGVSPATVSRAINNDANVAPDARRRVLEAVNRSGYRPAVGKRSTTNIAFLYTGEGWLASPFDAAVLQGMSRRLDDCGFDLMILTAGRSLMAGESFSQLFHRKGVRGAVVRTDARTRHLVRSIVEEGFPAVVLGDRFDDDPDLAVHSVDCDSRAGSVEAVEHLLSLGHRRVGVALNRVDDADHRDRLSGYDAAMSAAGLAGGRQVFREEATLDGGAQLVRKLRALPAPPTAVYVGDPLMAVGALNEAARLGLEVPGDLSIVGFDDNMLRFVTRPVLTSVVQDAEEVGVAAFDVLQRLLERRKRADVERRVLPTRLELHESTAPPRAEAARS